MSDDDILDPNEIEALFSQSPSPPPAASESAPAEEAPAPEPEPAAPSGGGDILDASEIEALMQQSAPAPPPAAAASPDELLDQAAANLAAAVAPDLDSRNQAEGATAFEFQSFDAGGTGAGPKMGLDALQDVELDLSIELGRAELLIEEVLHLKEGAVVPLDKLAGDPVDILVNGRLIARGEVLVLNDNFCVRVAEILTPDF